MRKYIKISRNATLKAIVGFFLTVRGGFSRTLDRPCWGCPSPLRPEQNHGQGEF